MANRIGMTMAGYLVLVSGTVSAAGPGWQGPSLIGTIQLYQKSEPAKKETGKIYISRDGLRSELPMPGGRMTTIENAKAAKCWYVLDAKKVYMESNINPKTGDCQSFMGESNPELSKKEAEPCELFAKKALLGADTVAGRAVEKWSCSGGKFTTGSTEWYDQKLKIVLKEVSSSGEVMEFTELKETSFANSLLEKPKTAKLVSSEQFRQTMFASMLPPGMPSGVQPGLPPGMPPLK